MKIHESITVARALEAAEREMFGPGTDNPGFCLACGADADGCEPDARGYTCDECGAQAVYGAAEVVMLLA